MKKVLKHTMSAAAAGGLLLVLYAMKELFPFGEFTVSWCDMNQQVVPLLCEFKDILEGKGSLFLNLQNAGGMERFCQIIVGSYLQPFYFSGGFCRKMADDALCQYPGTIENHALRRLRISLF